MTIVSLFCFVPFEAPTVDAFDARNGITIDDPFGLFMFVYAWISGPIWHCCDYCLLLFAVDSNAKSRFTAAVARDIETMYFSATYSEIIELVEFGVPINDEEIKYVVDALKAIEPDVSILDSIINKMSKMNTNSWDKEEIISRFFEFNLEDEYFDNNDYWKYFIDNISTKETNEICLLHVAVWRDNKEAMRYLISKGVNVDQRGDAQKTPLFYVKSKEAFDVLIQVKDIDVAAEDEVGKSFYDHIRNDNLRSHVNEYFKHRDAFDKAPKIAFFSFIISGGFPPFFANLDPIKKEACLLTDWMIMDKMIKNNCLRIPLAGEILGKDPKKIIDGSELLHQAVHEDNVEAIQYFIKKGANVNQRDEYAQTPLFFIKSNEAFDILMKAKDIDVAAKNYAGKSFYEWIILRDHDHVRDYADFDLVAHVEEYSKDYYDDGLEKLINSKDKQQIIDGFRPNNLLSYHFAHY